MQSLIFDMHFLDYEWFSVLSLYFLAISNFFSIFCEIITCIPYKIFYFVHLKNIFVNFFVK